MLRRRRGGGTLTRNQNKLISDSLVSIRKQVSFGDICYFFTDNADIFLTAFVCVILTEL